MFTLLAVLLGVIAAGVIAATVFFFRQAQAREAADAGGADGLSEMRAIGQRIETLVGQQQLQGETSRQHLAQKIDAVGEDMAQQRNHLSGLQNELRHEKSRRDAEMDEIRSQLASIQHVAVGSGVPPLALPERREVAPATGAPEPAEDETPAVEAHTFAEPTVEAPSVEAPTVEEPAVDAQAFEVPAAEAPPFEAPPFEAPAFEAPVVETSTFETIDFSAIEAPTFEPATFEAPAFEEADPDTAAPSETHDAEPAGDGLAAFFNEAPPSDDWDTGAPADEAPTFTDPFALVDPFATADEAPADEAPTTDPAEAFETSGAPADDGLLPLDPPPVSTGTNSFGVFEDVSFGSTAGFTFENLSASSMPSAEVETAPAPPSESAWIARADRPDPSPVQAPAAQIAPEPTDTAPSFDGPMFDTASPFDAPGFDAPAYDAPAFDALPAETPAFDAPAIEAPTLEAPAFELKTLDPAEFDLPAFEAPTFEVPTFEVPTFEVPTFEAPSFEAPAVNPAPFDVSAAEAPAFEAPTVEAPDFEAPAPSPTAVVAPTPDAIPEGADDLTVISTVDADIQHALYKAGVTSLDEIARWSRTDARRIAHIVQISEETILNQWVFEAQSALFQSFKS